MFQKILVSLCGYIFDGSTFIHEDPTRPGCTFLHISGSSSEGPCASVIPDCVAFSCFDSPRSARIAEQEDQKAEKYYIAGGHVALSYNNSGSFFSILIVRCDTWAIQWAVSAFSVSTQIRQVELLNAHLLCGLVYESESGYNRIFISLRLSTKHVRKHANRRLRHFVGQPHFIHLDLDDEKIVRIIAATGASFLVLSEKGSISLVEIVMNNDIGEDVEISITEKAVVTKSLPHVSMKSEMVCTAKEQGWTVVVFSPGCVALSVVSFTKGADTPFFIKELRTTSNFHILRVECVGSDHFVLTLEEVATRHAAFQFVSFYSTSQVGSPEFVLSDVLALRTPPVATYFKIETEEHVVICPSQVNLNTACQRGLTVGSLVQASFSFARGPYDLNALSAATWRPVRKATLFRDTVASLQSVSDDFRVGTNEEGLSKFNASVKLGYVLANPTEAGGYEVAVFLLDTLPVIHNRLVKQWHNATQGLKQLFVACFPIKIFFLVSWNPQHLRRALRLLGQEEVGLLFQNIAEYMSRPTTTDAFVEGSYPQLSIAAGGVAMHIITLARQMGLVLRNQDVETLVALFRSAREIGHECLRSSYRMKLLLESCLQQRRMNGLLYGGQEGFTAKVENNEPPSVALHDGYFGIPTEFALQRWFHTKYASSSWSDYLQKNLPNHAEVASRAMRYFEEAADFGQADETAFLVDWRSLGLEPHFDTTLNKFESSLLSTLF